MNIQTCIVGSYASGKTTLIQKHIYNDIVDSLKTQPTIGMSAMEKHHIIGYRQIKNIIFDTAGQERYASLIPIYLRNCQILIFAINSDNYIESLNYFKKIIPSIITLCKYLVVCFTKTDLSNIVENENVKDIDDILKCYDITYKILYTSSVNNKNINEPFTYFIEDAVKDKNLKTFNNIKIHDNPNVTKSRGCCTLS